MMSVFDELAVFLSIILFALMAGVVIDYIVTVVACKAVFNKTDHSTAKAFIPGYNLYLVYDDLKIKSYFWWCLIIGFGFGFIGNILESIFSALSMDGIYNVFSGIFSIAITALCVYIKYVFAKELTDSFGYESRGMTVLGIFFPRIVMMICGFGPNKFRYPLYERQFTDDMRKILRMD